MSENKKVYTIEIDGVEKAYENVCLLKDALIDLEAIATKSKLGAAISNIFGSIDGISKVVQNFGNEVEKFGLKVQEIDAIIKNIGAVQDIASTAVPESVNIQKEKEEKTNVKSEEKAKLTPQQEQLGSLNKSAADAFTKASKDIEANFKEEKSFYQQMLEAIKAVISKGRPEEKKEGATQTQAQPAETANANPKSGKSEEPKKEEPKFVDKNFGLNDIESVEEKKVSKKTNADGRTNVDESRKNFEGLLKTIDEYDKKLAKVQDKSDAFFDEMLEQSRGNDEEIKAITQAREDMDAQIESKRQDGRKKRGEVDKALNEMQWKSMVETYDAIKKVWDEYNSYAVNSLEKAKAYYTANKELYTAEADEIKAKVAEIDKSLTASTAKKKSLLEEEKKASGGRAVVIQEQLAREMQAEQELTKQKAELSKQEEKLREKAKKEEKRAKRMEIISGAAQATASVAQGIAKELSKGLWGIPTALIIAAQGAIQVATIKKQLDKINLEDGGLLRGKRHSQGGMRIEGTNIEVEGDEYVVNRVSTRKNLGLIDFINKSRKELSPSDVYAYYGNSGKQPQQRIPAVSPLKRMYDEGGQLTNLNLIGGVTAPSTEDKVLDAISKINFNPVVSVVDIVNAQESVASVKQAVGV